MKECEFCDEIGKENDGVWKIIIFRKFRGSYGKKYSPICHDCLADALTGYHTGGGLVGSVIKKIKRIDRDVFYKNTKIEKYIKFLKKDLAKRFNMKRKDLFGKRK